MKPILFAVLYSLSALAQAPPQDEISTLQTQLERGQTILEDGPNLARYRMEDADLALPAEGVQRVVFMGDSITDAWGRQYGKFFPGKPYVNRGKHRS